MRLTAGKAWVAAKTKEKRTKIIILAPISSWSSRLTTALHLKQSIKVSGDSRTSQTHPFNISFQTGIIFRLDCLCSSVERVIISS